MCTYNRNYFEYCRLKGAKVIAFTIQLLATCMTRINVAKFMGRIAELVIW